jgi:hypothetical protein
MHAGTAKGGRYRRCFHELGSGADDGEDLGRLEAAGLVGRTGLWVGFQNITTKTRRTPSGGRFQGTGFRLQVTGYRLQVTGSWVGLGCGSALRISPPRHQGHGTGLSCQGSGVRFELPIAPWVGGYSRAKAQRRKGRTGCYRLQVCGSGWVVGPPVENNHQDTKDSKQNNFGLLLCLLGDLGVLVVKIFSPRRGGAETRRSEGSFIHRRRG